MNIKIKKIKKLIFSLVVIIQIFFLGMPVTLAQSGNFFPIQTPSSAIRDIERRYNVDQNSMKDLMQGANVSMNKDRAPQVFIYFDNDDPRPGEKITAQAFPMYFSSSEDSMYFTWYLKHPDCNLTDNITVENSYCDVDNDNDVDVEDWKIEAARIMVNNGFDTQKADYGTNHNNDNDGYVAKYGGEERLNDDRNANDSTDEEKKYCYIHDFSTGRDYELTRYETPGDAKPSCSHVGADRRAVCLETKQAINADGSAALNLNFTIFNNLAGTAGAPGGGTGTGMGDTIARGMCSNSGETPVCWNVSSGTAAAYCYVDGEQGATPDASGIKRRGYPACLTQAEANKLDLDTSHACNQAGSFWNNQRDLGYLPSCDYSARTGDDSCYNPERHLFPNAPGHTSGDGDFRTNEEIFWRTNPDDPNTASIGQGDEANVVGLGLNEFKWNYFPGDQLGVAVEGTSLISTKHENASMMTMWALPKNKCDIDKGAKGSYTEKVKGETMADYFVNIETANRDINKCLPDNLLDPREGGQATNLEVSVEHGPETPVNDVTGDGMGDVVVANALIQNASKNRKNICYEWWVQESDRLTAGNWKDRWDTICSSQRRCLDDIPAKNSKTGSMFEERPNPNAGTCVFDEVSSLIGNGNSQLSFKLDQPGWGDGDVRYLKVNVRAVEIFGSSTDQILYGSDAQKTREGTGDTIFAAVSTNKKIRAWRTEVDEGRLNSRNKANILSPQYDFDGDGSEDPICQDTLKDRSICPIVKNEIIALEVENPGDLQNYSWTLNDQPLYCDSEMSSYCGEEESYINFFPVIGEVGDYLTVNFTGTDLESDEGKVVKITRVFQIVEPYIEIIPDGNVRRYNVGTYQYVDKPCTGDCDYMSESLFEVNQGDVVEMHVKYHPSWLWFFSKGDWLVDNERWSEFDGIFEPPITAFPANKDEGDAYNIRAQAVYNQPDDIRRAIELLWDVDYYGTTEIRMEKEVTVEIPGPDLSAQKDQAGFLAALSYNLPMQIMFLLKIMFVGIMMLGASSIAFAFQPNDTKGRSPETW